MVIVRVPLLSIAGAGLVVAFGLSQAAPFREREGHALILTFDPGLSASAARSGATMHTQFPQPDEVPGVEGKAWRSDGFSSWISAPLTLKSSSGFSVTGWVALESYPSDREVPVDELAPASFINQADATGGFDLFIDTFGRWGLRVSTDSGMLTVKGPGPFPLYRWAHVAATYDPPTGAVSMYLDGKRVGRALAKPGSTFRPASGDLRIGRSWRDVEAGAFRLNGVNAAFDEIAVVHHAMSAEEILGMKRRASPPEASASLVVPPTRFAKDFHRPVYHAMPPANWTNEPHGLIRRGDWWHLFYQRTPNGPYKTQMHWGHMKSRDLVDWTHLPDALWPTLQTERFGFDMKGIWSGTVVTGKSGTAYAFYTSVNHSPAMFNPGISVAVSSDADLRMWRKLGPIINADGLRDFRDPIVWFEGGEWRMLVGAAMPTGGGGLAYYRCGNIDDANCWRKQPTIAPFPRMDVGSDIWEMPVFEPIGRGRHILVVNPIGGRVSKYGASSTRAVYWIGSWNGAEFKPDDMRPKMLDVLPGHLSPTVTRDSVGQLVGIGIVDERRSVHAQKAAGWAHTFGLPRSWRMLEDGRTLGQSPLPALSRLRSPRSSFQRSVPTFVGHREGGDLGASAEYQVEFLGDLPRKPYGVTLGSSPAHSALMTLTYDPRRREFLLHKGATTGASIIEGPSVLAGAYDEKAFGPPRFFHVFIDHSVVEVFINNAAAVSFRLYPPQRASTRFGLAAGSPATASVRGWRLRRPNVRYDFRAVGH